MVVAGNKSHGSYDSRTIWILSKDHTNAPIERLLKPCSLGLLYTPQIPKVLKNIQAQTRLRKDPDP